MSFSWSAIREDLARSSSTLQSQRDYRAVRSTEPSLRPYTDIVGLLGALHHGHLDFDGRNAILAALVRRSQGRDRPAGLALHVMLLALWPGLDAVRNRCLRRRIGSPDEIASDLVARTTELIRTLDLARVNQIAATVLRNVERDMVRSACREDARRQRSSETDPDGMAAPPSWAEQTRMRRELQHDLTAVIGPDTDLILGVALDGASQIEMAEALDLTASAARKRYQRAIARLRGHYRP